MWIGGHIEVIADRGQHPAEEVGRILGSCSRDLENERDFFSDSALALVGGESEPFASLVYVGHPLLLELWRLEDADNPRGQGHAPGIVKLLIKEEQSVEVLEPQVRR